VGWQCAAQVRLDYSVSAVPVGGSVQHRCAQIIVSQQCRWGAACSTGTLKIWCLSSAGGGQCAAQVRSNYCVSAVPVGGSVQHRYAQNIVSQQCWWGAVCSTGALKLSCLSSAGGGGGGGVVVAQETRHKMLLACF